VRRRGRPAVAALLVAGLLVSGAVLAPPLLAAGAAPTAAGEVRRRVERILDVPGYQTTMPEAEAPAAPAAPPRIPTALVEALGLLVLGAAAAGGVALLVFLSWDLLRRRGRRPTVAAAGAAAPPPPRAAGDALPDAEALARDGRFGEAVHALLLHAFAGLARRRGAPLPAGLTSREAMRASSLDAGSHGALAELVAAVERFVFAGRPLAADDWQRCRAAYERLGSRG